MYFFSNALFNVGCGVVVGVSNSIRLVDFVAVRRFVRAVLEGEGC